MKTLTLDQAQAGRGRADGKVVRGPMARRHAMDRVPRPVAGAAVKMDLLVIVVHADRGAERVVDRMHGVRKVVVRTIVDPEPAVPRVAVPMHVALKVAAEVVPMARHRHPVRSDFSIALMKTKTAR